MTNGTSDFTRSLARRLRPLLPTTPRARRGLALCSLLVLGPALFASLPLGRSPDSACEAMKRWASRYAGTSPTLDEIAPFTRAQRVAIFNAISPAVRASLWQDQLRRFNQEPDLTAEQHALIEEGMSLTTVALYEQRPDAVRAHRMFWDRASKSFAVKPHLRIWMDLGAVVPQPGTADASSAPSVVQRVMDSFQVNAAFGPCECQSPNDIWTCPNGTCISGGCSIQPIGCGPNWGQTCNGLCR